MNDTIAAIATPYGSGGIGVIRISGPNAFAIASALFSKEKTKSGTRVSFESHRVCHGYIFNAESDDILDEVLILPMRGPKSYTAEDVVEIQAHAGPVVLRCILSAVLDAGARLSEPGEFTKRAFLNGRIDLTQAEAVADIINARSENSLKYASSQNLGVLKNRIHELREKLVNVLSLIEVNIDFPDESQPFDPCSPEAASVDEVIDACREFIRRYEDACFLKDGIRISICGAPNVGKSSLMNALLDQDRSIVTAVPGTTRDPVEEVLNIEGIPFVIVDTAGVHQTDDLVEIIGIERARDHVRASDLVLFLKEPGSDFSQKEFENLIPPENQATQKIIFVINKIDLADNNLPELPERYADIPVVEVSALYSKGIKDLKHKIVDISMAHLDMEKSSVIPNLRHKKALEKACRHLEAVKSGFENHQEEETIAIEMKNCIDALGTITGETASVDILDSIFSNFCIGK